MLAFASVGCKSIAGYDDVVSDGPRDARIHDGDIGTHDGEVPDGDFSLADGNPDGAATYPTPSGPLVSEEGWQWEHPKPQGNAIHALWGFGDDNIWAVGDEGTVLHFDGRHWSAEQVPRPAPDELRPALLGLWGVSAAELWAVGEGGAIYRHGPSGWTRLANSPTGDTLRGIWGSSPTDIHVVGGNFDVASKTTAWYRFSGSGWTSLLTGGSDEPGETLYAVWGSGPTDVWAVGDEEQAYRYDGKTIASHELGYGEMRAIVGRSTRDIWAVGTGSTNLLLHFDGSSWAPAKTRPQGTNYLYGLTLGVQDRVYAVGHMGLGAGGVALQWINNAWSLLEPPPADALRAAWSFSDGRLLTAGDDGVLLTYDGMQGWQRPGATTTAAIRDIFHAPGGTTRAVSDGGVILKREPGGSWVIEDILEPKQTLRALWGTSESDLYAVGTNNTLLHFDGSQWTEKTGPSSDPTSELNAIWGSGPDDIWIVDAKHAGTVYRYTGSQWALQAIDARYRFRAVWGTGPTDVWLVGNYNVTCHFDGQSWDCEEHSSGAGDSLQAIHGPSSELFVAVGDGGKMIVRSGGQWSYPTSTDVLHRHLRDVAVVSPTEAWAVGDSGLVLHLNLGAWEISDAATTRTLNAVERLDSGEVFLSGDRGAILRQPLSP